MRNRILKFCAGLVIVAALPVFSFAQSTVYSLPNELNVDLNPEYPKPHETVSVVLTMYTEDLDSSFITWYKNGQQVLSGRGEKRYSFKAGAIGEKTGIEIQVRLLSGTTFSKKLSITPASVDLVWEANSYVPPFYRGKALHPRQGTLKIVAMPEFVADGSRVAPQNLIYKWSNGTNAYENQSGFGKNILSIKGSELGQGESIRVSVLDPVSNMAAYGSIGISPVDPEIVFYEKSPYYGPLFDQGLKGSYSLSGDEVQIVAAPYYFTNEKSGLLKYEWRLNGQAAPTLAGSRTAIFKKPEGVTGRSTIALNLENINRILQQADQSLTINFSK